jgi:hypothetical protein
LHSPDGKKRGGAEAAILDGPLVMQVVMRPLIPAIYRNFRPSEKC